MQRKSKSERLTVGNVRFVGEQDGPNERKLKERLVPYLAASRDVTRGYLAQVEYEASSSVDVALCLRASQVGGALLKQIHDVFASLAGRDQHLDILAIGEVQERDLAKVCEPFFVLAS